MTSVRRAVRKYVEAVPFLAQSYREIRDSWNFRRASAMATPYGFTLSGNVGMAHGTFEPLETAFVSDALKTSDIFVDVGANIGLYTCLALSLGKHVVAVEPLPENLHYLFKNIAANRFRDIEVFPLGLGAEPALIDIYGGHTGASLVEGWADSTPAYSRTIPLTTMDIVLGERFPGAKLVVKVDVEGAEDEVLAGAVRTMRRLPAPTWLVEIALTEHHPSGLHPRFAEVFERFWSAGYEAYTIGPGRRRVSEKDVKAWIDARSCDSGHNYEFSQAVGD